MNWIDAIYIVVFCFYVYEDCCRGFLRICADLTGLVLAFVIAMLFYDKFAFFLAANASMSLANARPLSFLLIWIVMQLMFFGFSKIVSFYTPRTVKESKVNRYLSFLPALVKGLIFVVVMTILVLVLPISSSAKNTFKKSFFAQMILRYSESFTRRMENVFENQAPTPGTSKPAKDESTDLKFTTTEMTIDDSSEKIILQKVNEERGKVGLQPLASDTLIRNVARAHSRDMLVGGYFSHVENDGQTLFDRLTRAKVDFREGAENIAYAPTAELAHTGLMNSEKHRNNILDPSFTRIGIGVMNAGQYGLMITQNFAQ